MDYNGVSTLIFIFKNRIYYKTSAGIKNLELKFLKEENHTI
jgi:hypothetical protein